MTETASERARLWTPSTWPTIVGILVLMLFIAFESVSIATVLPVVTTELGGRQWYSLAFAGTLTTALVGMIVGGGWADRRGISVPLVVGGTLFVTGVIVCAAAPTILVFIAGRVVQGFGAGVVTVLLYVIVAKTIPETAQARMLGLLSAAWVLPSMIGPLAAGALVEAAHWRWVFIAVAAFSAIALTGLLTTVRRIPPPVGASATAVLGHRGWWALAAAAALLAVHIGSGQPMPHAAIWPTLGVVALIAVAVRLLPRGTLRGAPGAPRLIALRGILGAAVAATDVYIPLYLQIEKGVRPAVAGFLVAVGAVGWLLGAITQGRLENRTEPRILLRCAFLLALIGPIGATAVIAAGAPICLIAVSSITMGAGMGIAYPVVTSTTLRLSPPDQHGFYSSSLQAAESMATSAFLAVTGLVLTLSAYSYTVTYALIIAIAILAAIVGWQAVDRPILTAKTKP